jgi:hypothetical protein
LAEGHRPDYKRAGQRGGDIWKCFRRVLPESVNEHGRDSPDERVLGCNKISNVAFMALWSLSNDLSLGQCFADQLFDRP